METERQTLIEHLVKDPRSLALAPERLVGVAHQDSVFGTPLQKGDYTVVPAAEVTASMGFGFGGGVGGRKERPGQDVGGGGGGGGHATARPVAAIVLGPTGVEVRPIIDVTKVVLAGTAAFGMLLFSARRIAKASRKANKPGH